MNGSGSVDLSTASGRTPLSKHVAKTYGWMFVGLLITFAVATGMIMTGLVSLLFINAFVPFIALILQLVLVVVISSKLKSLSVMAARGLFLLYSVMMGISFSSILLFYGFRQATFVFAVACIFFGVMAAAGVITKRDVSKFSSLVIGALVVMLILTLVNIFLHVPAFDTFVCFLGLFLFMGITTYDAKKTKDWFFAYEGDEEMLAKASIFSALSLYLDFLNIFIYLLRLLSNKD